MSKDKKDKEITIHVGGDDYCAIFFIPPGQCLLPGIDGGKARAIALPVGKEYMYRAIKTACELPVLLTENNSRVSSGIDVKKVSGNWGGSDTAPTALYEIRNIGEMTDIDDQKTRIPILRLARAETQQIALERVAVVKGPSTESASPSEDRPNILVDWFGELGKNRTPPNSPPECDIHIQVGLPSPIDEYGVLPHPPAMFASPCKASVVVVNIGELSATQRIRRSLSYEAIAVDLLRFLRGTNATPEPNALLSQFLEDKTPPLTVLAVRLNNSAVFLYTFDQGTDEEPIQAEHAWLLCHKDECAPLSEPKLGQMVGYTGSVTSQIVAAVAAYLDQVPNNDSLPYYGPCVCSVLVDANLDQGPNNDRGLVNAIAAGVRRSLIWQRANFDRGCLFMFFNKDDDSRKWKVNESTDYYEAMFSDIVTTLQKQGAEVPEPPEGMGIADWLEQFHQPFTGKVFQIPVQISRAVAHRTQWFMARSLVVPATDNGGAAGADLEHHFQQIALNWLSKESRDAADRKSIPTDIPIVRIGKAELTDRREVEDFLAIYQALTVYAHSREGKPLNIAVFGAPGSGKSYAVRQVVQHISDSREFRFKTDPLTFNLGQFKSLDDLPAALHLVRNECLSRDIPIIFFDEFDSSFHGQPFGWLKYFLAPMQDGEFYHAGQNYKLGNAVFVFAGGVNRSFEELNARMRNPGFCEAKGPDFISRLKAHLNVQGINKSEGEADQARYILRRGILLRGLARRQLRMKDDEKEGDLFHPSVARALLEIERFKHGVRSLEAIIKMCATRPGHPIGPSDLPSMDQLEMHVDAMKLLGLVEKHSKSKK